MQWPKSQALEGRITKLRGELEKLNAQGKKRHTSTNQPKKALKQLEKSYGNYQNKIKETERILNNLSGSTIKNCNQLGARFVASFKTKPEAPKKYTAKAQSIQLSSKRN